MKIVSIELKDFRCFYKLGLSCNNNLIFISGNNGSGKSSLLEALHYVGYLKSFRTTSPRDMIAEKKSAFSVFLQVEDEGLLNDIQIGFSPAKRSIRINDRVISAYQDLVDRYRVITIHADDILLIQGSPESRRSFLDQAIMIYDPAHVKILRSYKHTLDQRNALLMSGGGNSSDLLLPWTKQLWHYAYTITTLRIQLIERLVEHMKVLVATFFNDSLSIAIRYMPKKELGQTFDQFLEVYPQLLQQELILKRSCFGPHLDDFVIRLNLKNSRQLASRGQQKCIAFLLKIALFKEIEKITGTSAILCDDLFSEFDAIYTASFVQLLTSINAQVFITMPEVTPLALDLIARYGALHLNLPL